MSLESAAEMLAWDGRNYGRRAALCRERRSEGGEGRGVFGESKNCARNWVGNGTVKTVPYGGV